MPVLEGYWQASIRARLKSKNRSPTVQTPEIKFWGSRDRRGYKRDVLAKTRTIPASWLG